jgi:protein-tyrosine phosphatase
VIDLHCHILPGLDDGARDLEDSVAMARSLAEDGVRIVAATPHVRDDYPATPAQIAAALVRVREAVRAAGIDLDVRGGAEIALGRLGRLTPEELAGLGLGGNPRLLLLEYPYHGRPLALARDCGRLRADGIVPVIAHPERNAEVQERPQDLQEAVAAGAVVQLTAASVDGRLGRPAATAARRLLDLELAHLIAGDAHAPHVRESGLAAAAAAAGSPELGRWLTSSVPAALLAGEELPRRPADTGRRGGILGRLRGSPG